MATIAITADNSKKVRRMLGLSLHGWENAMVVFLILAGFTAFVAGAATWAVVRLQRIELAKSEQELEKFKLETAKDISEANARTSQAQLELQRLKSWRMVDADTFKAELAGTNPPPRIELLYVPECSDCFMVASMFQALFNDMRWPCSFSEIKKLDPPPYDWMRGMPAVLQHRANPTGISIVTNKVGEFDGKSTPALLIRAIGKSVQGINMQWSGDELMPDGAVRVVIAPKL